MKFIINIFCWIQFSYAFRPEVTLYMEYNFTGTALTLRTKETDLRSLAPSIINEYKSRCSNGLWAFYLEENYDGGSEVSINWSPNTVLCYNDRFQYNSSARYLGPQETDRATISFYSKINYIGEELTIDGPAFTSFPFPPQSLFTTGFSNWTLYSGTNFDGIATCFTSTNEYHLLSNLPAAIHNVSSILRGCPTKSNNIFLGDNVNS